MSVFKNLKSSINRAEEEKLFVVKNSTPNSQDFIVLNETKLKAYNVTVEDQVIINCSCPHARYRDNIVCKHQIKVSIETRFDIRLKAR